MKNFHLILIKLITLFLTIESHSHSRQKRLVIFPPGSTFVQLVLGFGLPFQVDKRSVTVGPFVKSIYYLPRNSTDFTNPGITDISGARRKRRGALSRWNLYTTLSATANFLGFGGKACILRAICEAAETPFSDQADIFTELLHVIFTPSSTLESVDNNFDYEYHAAENLGKTVRNCKHLFPECKFNLMDKFTKIFSHL